MADEVMVLEAIGPRASGALPVNFLAKQSLTIGGAASSALNRSTQQVVVISTTGCVIEFGAAPDGLGITFPIAAGHPYTFDVVAGHKIIAAAGTATAPVVSGGTGTSSNQVQGNIASGDVDAGNPVKIGALVQASPVATGLVDGDRTDIKTDGRGYVWVNIGVGGTSAVTSTGVNTVAKGATTGGLTSGRVVTGTTGVIKGSAGTLFALSSVQNANAGVRYLHLYNKATAPTLSTDTPILTITLAASSVQNNINFTAIGAAFSTGIAWAYTTDNIAIPATAGTSAELMFSASYA